MKRLPILASLALLACSDAAGPPRAASPNFIKLVSDVGDYIGAGRTYDYTQANAIISITGTGGHLHVGVNGDEGWRGDFMTPLSKPFLAVGQYDGLALYPLNDPDKGGLGWVGQGRRCMTATGAFQIDRVRYDGTTLKAIDLSFEQHCNADGPAIHGTLHWDSADTTQPAGPVYPIPQGLWTPAAGATPATGNYIYLESDTNDWIGAGKTYTYTPDSSVTVRNVDGFLNVVVRANEQWYGYFLAMSSLSKLRAGLYSDLTKYGFNNPTKGGVLWWGGAGGHNCDTLHGWFAVDNVTYQVDSLTSVDVRFEQHCEGAAPALHGAIHWIR